MNRHLILDLHRFCGPAASLLALAALPMPSYAGGIRDIPLTSIPVARNPITVDGSFSDWPDTHPVPFSPIDPGLAKSNSAALAQMRRHPDSAALQTSYDSKYLYLGIVWTGLARTVTNPSIELHFKTDRVTHIRIASGMRGPKKAILIRFDNETEWHHIEQKGAACVVVPQADGTTTQEIRVPWSSLTQSGTTAPNITLAADLEWPNLTQAFITQLPTRVLHDNTHLAQCFLTSQDKLFTRDAYLGNSSDWGTLHFVDQLHENATQVSTQATGATEAYVTKVSSPLEINGHLTGWNATQFQSVAYAPGFLGDRYSAKVATSYDGEYLYLAAHVKSRGGPINTQAEATQAGYAGGDCLQVRLNDGHHTVNLCGWYDSVRKKAALTADGNDLQNGFLLTQGAKEAFQIDADGQGYTQEMAIPWKLLPTGTAPKAGDSWHGTFQFWWSGLNPQFTVLANAQLAQGGGIAYAYQLAKEANVTLGIFDVQGHLVQTLIKDAHRRAGHNTEYWDGKDQFGSTVAPGKYQIRGIDHPPITTQHAISIGNPGTPPWPTADGEGDWLSDESAPQGAVTDGTNVYFASPGSEKGHDIMAVGPDGKRIWGYNEATYPRCVSLALHGQYLFALFSGPESVHATGNEPNKIGRAFIVCLNKDTGVPAQFSTQKVEFRVATWPFVDQLAGLWDLRVNKNFTPATYGGQPRYFANDLGEPTEAMGIAAVGNQVYVSMFTQNQILVLDAATGKQLDTIPVPQPVGLYGLANGKILGISNGKVVTIDPATKSVTTTIDHDLVAPHDVTLDNTGNVYVSDWGTSFQVKVFSPSGKFLRAIGKPGGRSWTGPWEQNGMLVPRGVAVTNDGKLWVAEDDSTPNRISVWNAKTGDFVRDYLGPSAYGGGGHFWADPTNPSMIMAEGTFFHVDYAKKTWTPISTAYRRMSKGASFTPNGMNGMPGSRTITHDGKQYVYMTDGAYTIVVFRHDGDAMHPVAAIGSLGRGTTTDGSTRNIWDSDIGGHNVPLNPSFFAGHRGDNYIWIDKNGDSEVQPDEMQWAQSLSRGDTFPVANSNALPEFFADWGMGVGPDGAVYPGGEAKGSHTVSRIDLQGWSANGVPLYDLTTAKAIVAERMPGGAHGIYVNDSNRVFVVHGYEWNPGKHNAVDTYDRNGKLLWSYYAPEGRQQADDFLADNIIGEFHAPGNENLLASWLWHGNFKPYLLTEDGLYVSSLLDDTKLGPTATWDESYKNYFQAPDGSAYIVNGANDAYHIDKIIGLDKLHRFSGSISVTQADLTAAANASAQAATVPVPIAQPVIHVTSPQAMPTVDGSLADWNMDSGVSLKGTNGRSARVALAKDATHLYLAYDVHGAKLVNKGGNWQTLFITGDCVDLMLHTGPYQTHFSPAEGDERLLLSVYQGQPVAVLYHPVVPGTTNSTRMMAANIDQIIRLTSAKIATQKSGDGYTLEASIPLSDLGIDSAQTDPMHGDVGVIYADETGSNRALRLYYYNHDTNMTADLTTEATLQPGNWGDLDFSLGPNLIKNGDFEEPLATSPTAGWTVGETRNGGGAVISSSVAYSGAHSLLLHQTTPVTFTPEAYQLPDYGDFVKSANGGKGGGYIVVRQTVPVTGGKKYAFRFHLHTVDFHGGENKNPGPNRGYVSLQLWMHWEGTNENIWGLNYQDSIPDWKTLIDSRFNYYSVPVPYTAPTGATALTIQFSLVDNFAEKLPKAYLDNVELVEVP